MKNNPLVVPVVKWAGGKRQLWSTIKAYIPNRMSTYYEPFVGGGAVWLGLKPKAAVINDINDELMNVYEVIRDSVDELVEDLKKHRNESSYFYDIREMDRDKDVYGRMTKVQRASRILYLNKTCYNGLFRVNNQGEFNAPFGSYKNPNIVNEGTLRALSHYLNEASITLLNCDFDTALQGIRKGGFVYFDPPYDPVSSSANFTGYNKGGFDRAEQQRLKTSCDSLNEKGVKFLLSNSATDFILDLYRDYRIVTVRAKRAVNSRGDGRGDVDEVLVMNYE